MIDKQIRTDEFQKFRGGQMIFNRCKAYSGGNSKGPSQGTQEPGFADAKSPAAFDDIAGPVMLRKVKGIIGIIPDIVPNRIVEFYGLGNRIAARIFSIVVVTHSRFAGRRIRFRVSRLPCCNGISR